jgi:putative transcriptional regulator
MSDERRARGEDQTGRKRLLEEVKEILAKSGFYYTEAAVIRGITFDLIARRDRDLFFIKVLRNVDGFNRNSAEEIKSIAIALQGRPLIIGSHSGGGMLEDGIVYSRFEVPIITVGTLREELLEGVPPFIKAEPGGFYVHLDGEMLRRIREEMSLSLGALAEIAGVSRKAIQMYESGMKAMVEVAQRLEEFFNQPFVLPFEYWNEEDVEVHWNQSIEEAEGIEKEVFSALDEIGCAVLPTYHSPFNAIAKHMDDVLIAWCGNTLDDFRGQIDAIRSITRIAEKDAVIFLGDEGRTHINDIPVIAKQRLRNISGPEELIEIAHEIHRDY